ncbi:MAG: helix-turn-helix domain-containing protein [Bryobacteraceae bacterium]|jgi:excisionase family DNA binding protein|nr:helix-turn-helix domain-containing protein [Bryobacteraceae bacterium]
MLRPSDGDLNDVLHRFLDVVAEMLDVLAEKMAVRVVELLCRSGPPARRLLSVKEAAAYLGRSVAAVQHMIESGKLPAVRIDRRVAVDIRDLDRLIEASKTGKAGAARPLSTMVKL